MTAATLTAVTQWGVRHHGHFGSVDAVDVRANKDAACAWARALHYCGNHDAVVVHRDAPDAAWIPQGGTS